MIKAVIFDVGGVLQTNEIERVYSDIKETLQLSEDNFRKTYVRLLPLIQLGKITEDEFWYRFISESGSNQSLPEESLFIREFAKTFKPNKEVLALTSYLKQKGYKLGILSDTIAPHVEYLKAQGIYDNFEVKVFSNEVGLKKPDREIYLRTLRELNVKPNQSVFIDDKEDNIEAANKLGMNGVLFTNIKQLKKDLKKLKDGSMGKN